ncbi:phosphoribosyl-AMP cyclohydrolase, partial [Micromonospora chalcea]
MGPAPLSDTGFLDLWAARLRHAADRPVVGIMLRGSHARRAATEHSDVDVDVLVAADEPRATGGPRQVTSRRGTPYAARRAYLTEFGG